MATDRPTPDPLAALRAEFDALIAGMQTPEHRRAVEALMSATPEELGAAAVQQARRALDAAEWPPSPPPEEET